MDTQHQPTLAEQYAAALDWWREAGVDHDFSDSPQKLLHDPTDKAERSAPKPQERAKKPAPPPRPSMGGDQTAWPKSLDAFASWWLNEASLDNAPVSNRVAPRGSAGAELMVLVPMPELDDDGHLLSGTQGKLVANMLRAMGITSENSYIAAALPRHMPVADWAQLSAAGLGAILNHHLSLAAPKRLLVLGRDVLPLVGLARSQKPQELALGTSSIQALASFSPDSLLQNARLRANLWHSWLEWTGNGE